MWFRKKKRAAPEDVMRDLREQALALASASYDAGLDGDQVALAMMEISTSEAIVSVVCFADGTTSLYFSTGGGIIGAGDHATVHSANAEFREVVQRFLREFVVADDHAFPAAGHVRFYVRNNTGLVRCDVEEGLLSERVSPLWPLYAAGHKVITAIREASPER